MSVAKTVTKKKVAAEYGHDGWHDDSHLMTQSSAIKGAQDAANANMEPVVVWKAVGVVMPNLKNSWHKSISHLPVLN